MAGSGISYIVTSSSMRASDISEAGAAFDKGRTASIPCNFAGEDCIFVTGGLTGPGAVRNLVRFGLLIMGSIDPASFKGRVCTSELCRGEIQSSFF